MKKKSGKETFYQSMQIACKSRKTNISSVLAACGRSNGNIGNWKRGVLPNFEIVIEIAEHLGISLDELCYGPGYTNNSNLTIDEREWLGMLRRIPYYRRTACMDFLKAFFDEDHKEEYSPEQNEWMDIISRIPKDRQQLCKDFIKTHAVIPDKYDDKEKVS